MFDTSLSNYDYLYAKQQESMVTPLGRVSKRYDSVKAGNGQVHGLVEA